MYVWADCVLYLSLSNDVVQNLLIRQGAKCPLSPILPHNRNYAPALIRSFPGVGILRSHRNYARSLPVSEKRIMGQNYRWYAERLR